MDRPLVLLYSIQLYGLAVRLPKIPNTPRDHKSIQLHLRSQAVKNVVIFQNKIATIVSISQNLWQLWKKLWYYHTHEIVKFTYQFPKANL